MVPFWGQMQNVASLHTDEFPALLARLPPDLDLDQLAIEHKAIQRGRKIKTGIELLRLALAHGPGGMSLRDAAGWSGMLPRELTSESSRAARVAFLRVYRSGRIWGRAPQKSKC